MNPSPILFLFWRTSFAIDQLIDTRVYDFVTLELGREKLIHLALLTGSDYTEGIESVGPVTALEILAEFSSEGIEGLERFRDWLLEMQTRNSAPMNKIRHKLRNLKLRPGKSFYLQIIFFYKIFICFKSRIWMKLKYSIEH